MRLFSSAAAYAARPHKLSVYRLLSFICALFCNYFPVNILYAGWVVNVTCPLLSGINTLSVINPQKQPNFPPKRGIWLPAIKAIKFTVAEKCIIWYYSN